MKEGGGNYLSTKNLLLLLQLYGDHCTWPVSQQKVELQSLQKQALMSIKGLKPEKNIGKKVFFSYIFYNNNHHAMTFITELQGRTDYYNSVFRMAAMWFLLFMFFPSFFS